MLTVRLDCLTGVRFLGHKGTFKTDPLPIQIKTLPPIGRCRGEGFPVHSSA